MDCALPCYHSPSYLHISLLRSSPKTQLDPGCLPMPFKLNISKIQPLTPTAHSTPKPVSPLCSPLCPEVKLKQMDMRKCLAQLQKTFFSQFLLCPPSDAGLPAAIDPDVTVPSRVVWDTPAGPRSGRCYLLKVSHPHPLLSQPCPIEPEATTMCLLGSGATFPAGLSTFNLAPLNSSSSPPGGL